MWKFLVILVVIKFLSWHLQSCRKTADTKGNAKNTHRDAQTRKKLKHLRKVRIWTFG